MKLKLRPLDTQVVVITGATSGIGLVTARKAAAKRARLVLASRNEGALKFLADEINTAGGEAVHAVADVGNEEDVRRIAATARQRFRSFDTWVNNAGVSIYGNLTDVSLADHRRLFECSICRRLISQPKILSITLCTSRRVRMLSEDGTKATSRKAACIRKHPCIH